ncbi:hypothetical protein GSI_02539 [Ganoderma sinense ZZ0214-1]|uniref:Uncharacterized protein n=1 Tax=Ganoderma sinense ZZ0214-1 TaxID=1077348 RepID=A0A2G8SLW8_9APHY|nr:hypothetical protein GSI_02539 [Ganoderma sinense ZZ0214-1]
MPVPLPPPAPRRLPFAHQCAVLNTDGRRSAGARGPESAQHLRRSALPAGPHFPGVISINISSCVRPRPYFIINSSLTGAVGSTLPGSSTRTPDQPDVKPDTLNLPRFLPRPTPPVGPVDSDRANIDACSQEPEGVDFTPWDSMSLIRRRLSAAGYQVPSRAAQNPHILRAPTSPHVLGTRSRPATDRGPVACVPPHTKPRPPYPCDEPDLTSRTSEGDQAGTHATSTTSTYQNRRVHATSGARGGRPHVNVGPP